MARRSVGLNNRIPEKVHSEAVAEHRQIMERTSDAEQFGDLRFAPQIEYRRLDELTASRFNTVFQALKDDQYWNRLKEDMSDAGVITDPLLILPSGEIISGHSRQTIARELFLEGRREFERVPVRVLHSELQEGELRKRVYMANLSRFEIDTDTRLKLYAEIFPEYFEGKAVRNRPAKGDTVSPLRKNIAEQMHISERQIKREKQVYQKAKSIAEKQGRALPEVDEIRAARKEQNRKRRVTAEAAGKNNALCADGMSVYYKDRKVLHLYDEDERLLETLLECLRSYYGSDPKE